MAYFAPQLTPYLASVVGSSTAAAITTAVVSTAIATAASAAIGLVVGRPSAAGAGTPSVFRQSLANSFIVYGRRRVGGLLIFFHPRGKQFRYFVIAVAGHRCKGVVRWYLGDDEVTVDATGKVTSGTYAGRAWLWFYRGTEDQQAHPVFVAETEGKWTSAHRARGTALIYAKFEMTDATVQAGMPNITAEIDGKDTIYDPRDGSTGYTRNAQLVYRDFMATPREEGGFGCYPDELDDDWDAAQANVCDERMPLANGGSEPRYAFDAYIVTGAAPSEVRDTFVTCCAGTFTYSGGKMLMRPGYYVPPSATLHEDDLAGPITVPALLAGDQTANEVTGTFIDPGALYQAAEAPTRSLASDDVRQIGIDMPHVTSATQAQRVMEIALRKARAERRVTWPMNVMGIAIATLDTVQLATSRYGLSNYAFQVASWGLSQDFSVGLQLEETGPEIFEWNTGMELSVGAGGQLVRAVPITDGRAAVAVRNKSVSYPISSDDDSVMIAAHTGVLEDGTSYAFRAGAINGLASGSTFGAFVNRATGAYFARPYPASDAIASSDNIFLGWIATSTAGEYPEQPTPPGGWGGDGAYYEVQA